jgi:hypothetical protein
VEDITTALETGWKMLGEASPATIKFHKDSMLLIAVGEPGKLEIIDAVLKALEPPKPKPVVKTVIDDTTGLPVPAQRPKGKD